MDGPVLVAGAGIAGLTAALAFAAKGFRVEVFERSSELEAAGAGIQLSPNATRLLFDLGLESLLRAACALPDAVALIDAKSLRPLASVRLGAWGEARWGAPYLTCHRADLQRALLDAVLADPRIGLMTGASVSMRPSRSQATLRVARNGADFLAQGSLLIGADGVHSALRAALHPGSMAQAAGLTAWRRTISAEEVVADGTLGDILRPERVAAFLHKRVHLVAYPMRGNTFNLVAIGPSGGTAGGREDWKAFCDAFTGAAQPLKRLLDAESGWSGWPILFAPSRLPWTASTGVALIGDAAHAMAPFAAQGAAMAIEDAATLAEAFSRHPHAVALAPWEAGRRARIARVEQRGSLNRLAWHASGITALARNLVLSVKSSESLAADLDWLYGWRMDT